MVAQWCGKPWHLPKIQWPGSGFPVKVWRRTEEGGGAAWSWRELVSGAEPWREGVAECRVASTEPWSWRFWPRNPERNCRWFQMHLQKANPGNLVTGTRAPLENPHRPCIYIQESRCLLVEVVSPEKALYGSLVLCEPRDLKITFWTFLKPLPLFNVQATSKLIWGPSQ